MNKEYIQLVADLLTDEKVLLCVGVEELMAKLHYDEHYSTLQNIFNDGTERSELDNGHLVFGIYTDLLAVALNKLGIELSDIEISLQEVLTVLESVFSLTDEINVDVVDHVLSNADGDPVALLAELLGHTTDREMAYWYPVLESVDESLIAKIRTTSVSADVISIVTGQAIEIKETFAKVFPDLTVIPAIEIINGIMVLPANQDNLIAEVMESLKDTNALDKATSILAVIILAGNLTKESIMFELEQIAEANFVFTEIPAITYRVNNLIKDLS